MKGHAKISGNAGDPHLQLRVLNDDETVNTKKASLLLEPSTQITDADMTAGAGQIQIRKVPNALDANGKPLYIASSGPIGSLGGGGNVWL